MLMEAEVQVFFRVGEGGTVLSVVERGRIVLLPGEKRVCSNWTKKWLAFEGYASNDKQVAKRKFPWTHCVSKAGSRSLATSILFL